jgi:hypothetical protein
VCSLDDQVHVVGGAGYFHCRLPVLHRAGRAF